MVKKGGINKKISNKKMRMGLNKYDVNGYYLEELRDNEKEDEKMKKKKKKKKKGGMKKGMIKKKYK
jgi:hypothetical protein